MNNIEEIVLIPLRMLEFFTGSTERGAVAPVSKPPSTRALVTKTVGQKTAQASGSTGIGAGGTPMPASATQKAYVTHMPTQAPKPVTRRPPVRYK